MASAPADQVHSLGQVAYDAAGDGKLTFEEASLMISGSKLDYHPKKCVKKDRLSFAGDLSIFDLPLLPIAQSSTTKLVAFVDVVSNYEGTINFDKVHELCVQGKFKDLQEPLSLKQELAIPYTMQLFIVRQKPEDSECSAYRILKVVSFEKNRVDSATILKCARGEAHKIDYGGNFKTGGAAFQFMLEKLEGYQIRWARLDKDLPPVCHPRRIPLTPRFKTS